MKFFVFIFVLIDFVLLDVSIWDGKNYNKEIILKLMPYIYKNFSTIFNSSNTNDRLKKDIKIFDHIIFKNVLIYPIDVTRISSENNGIHIYSLHNGIQIIFTTNSKLESLHFTYDAYCHLTSCEIGLFLYTNYNLNGGSDLIKNQYLQYINVIYVKLIKSSNEYLLAKIKIKANHFPLMLCPFKNWVAKESMLEFHSNEENGIQFDKLNKRNILVPIYERNEGENKYKCGNLKYLDGEILDIGFELEISKNLLEDLKVRKIDIYKDSLVCSTGDKEADFYHFLYNDNNKTNIKMKFIDIKSLKNVSLYHNNKIYLYNIFNDQIVKLKNYGFTNITKGDSIEVPRIEPSCVIHIKPIHGKLVLKRIDSKYIDMEKNFLSDIKIWYIKENLLDKNIQFECEIEIENKIVRLSVENFYKETFKVSLLFDDGSIKGREIKDIKFTRDFNNFGKYECKLEPVIGNNLYNDSEKIQRLSFETIPAQEDMFREVLKWSNDSQINIKCKINLENFAKIINMKVLINYEHIYDRLNKKDRKYFSEKDNYVIFKHRKLVKKNIEKANFECFYKSQNGVKFSIKNKGTMVDNETKSNEGNLFNNNNITLVISIASITIILILVIIVVTEIVVIRKAKKKNELHHKDSKKDKEKRIEKNRKEKSDLESSDSSGKSLESIVKISKISNTRKFSKTHRYYIK
uniref:Ig-like domain-containing protein n=1 Tax=Parastrongyloides trichosuri TaxID=131310 RepID=A0A0N4Z6B2_PARTI